MVLVTGGTGLLGSHLLFELIHSGEDVKAIKRHQSDISHVKNIFSYYTDNADYYFSKIKWVDADLLDTYSLSEAMNGISDVYHCAAIVSFNKKDKGLMMKVNVEGTSNIVNVALENNIRKFCYVSSIASLGRIDNDGIIDENTHWKATGKNSLYAVSKYYAENEVWRGINEGLDAVIVNPSIIFGPGFWHKGSNELIKTLHNGLKFYPLGVNGFVDVRDVSHIMVSLLKSDISAQRFILSSANMSYKELSELFSKHLKVNPPLFKVGRFSTELYWRFEYVKSLFSNSRPLVTKETANTSCEKFYYSNDKVKNVLNFEFIPLEDTVKFLSEIFIKQVNHNG